MLARKHNFLLDDAVLAHEGSRICMHIFILVEHDSMIYDENQVASSLVTAHLLDEGYGLTLCGRSGAEKEGKGNEEKYQGRLHYSESVTQSRPVIRSTVQTDGDDTMFVAH